MPAVPKAPRKEQLREYLNRGLTQQEMADAYFRETGIRISRSAIAMALHRTGLSGRAPKRHLGLLPWTLRPEHRYHRDARYLRLESRLREGLPLTEADKRRLENWKEELIGRNAVVYYDPDSAGGWWWVERSDVDADLIRHPESLIPWEVRPKHLEHQDYRLLQLEVRRRRGEELWPKDREELERGLGELESAGLVITYSPTAGFRRVKATDADQDFTRGTAARAKEPAPSGDGESYCAGCKARVKPDGDGRCPACGGPTSRILGKA